MATYVNFYETVQESNMRLRNTIILYDGEPFLVLCVTGHKSDGIFRVYMEPVGEGESGLTNNSHAPSPYGLYSQGSDEQGIEMDKYLSANPNSKILRKMMNSPKFNKFRPYPLGMMNQDGRTFFLQRQPNRKVEQGLIYSMVQQTEITLEGSRETNGPIGGRGLNDFYGAPMCDCILGAFPTAEECLEAMLNPNIENTSIAFHRNFAFIRGPLNTVFFVYKTEIVGILPSRDFSNLHLAAVQSHLREAIEELNLFTSITIN